MSPSASRGQEPAQRNGYAPGRPLPSGETVVNGRYRCLGCGHRHAVSGVVNLPVCPRCQGDAWELEQP